MLTPKFQSNLNKLINIVNCSDDTVICRVIIINDNKSWRKSILDAINVDHTLYTSKNYDITCERFNNDEYVKSEFRGCINILIENMLNAMESLECMLITISNTNYSYNKQKGILQKSSFVYSVLQN
jgi:hypothetical protein